MNVLLTGGAGYIGSHTAVELAAAGHGVIIADNFCNSSPKVLDRLEEITKNVFLFMKLTLWINPPLKKFLKKTKSMRSYILQVSNLWGNP